MDSSTRGAHAGFTLVELLIGLAVVGILAAVVIPTYNSSVNKSRRAECRSALVLAAQNEERYFTTNNVYASLSTAGAPTWSGSGATQTGSACTLTAYQGSTATASSQTAISATTTALVIVAQPLNWTDTQCNASYYALDSTGNFTPLTSGLAVPSTVTANCF